MSRLLIINGPNVGVTYELGDRTRIGRLGENEIQVPDSNVSRIHSEIVLENNAYVIYDRASKNGVIINGEHAAQQTLQAGDEIVIGGSTFLFDGDLKIHNARFSNNSVYFLADSGDDITQSAISLDKLAGSGRELSDRMLEIAKIFAGPSEPVPAMVERMCERIRVYFQADHAILFLKVTNEAEMRPYEAAPHNEPVCVNAGLLNRVTTEKRPLSLTELQKAPTGCGFNQDDEPASEAPEVTEHTPSNSVADRPKRSPRRGKHPEDIPVSMICAPLMADAEVTGLLLVSRQHPDPFPIGSLAILECMAAFAAIQVQTNTAPDTADSCHSVMHLNAEQRAASTRSLRMQEIYNSARRSADGPGTVLITGEIGTGKETLARFIHESSSHADGPSTVVNCAAIRPEDFETEFFGREKDAENPDRPLVPGKVEQAIGGTLFLDEVGALDISLQPKLLRFLQDRAFYRVGGTNAVEADIKVIAASTLDLAAAVRAGKFREDLWYRLNVVPFHMPPLRERREDIGPLVDFFIARHSHRFNRRVLGANDSTINMLQKYDWPGNIRELDNAVERAVLLCDSKILSNSDFLNIEEARRRLNSQADLERKRDTKPLADVERQHIMIALKKHNYNQARAAEALGLHRNTLRNKVIEYGIEIPK